MTRLLLIGPPGAGKGTQASSLAQHFGIPAISTGDIFRANVKNETELGLQAKGYMDRGEYVPDALTNALVRDRIAQPDAQKGFLLDGYPRTIDQVQQLDGFLAAMNQKLDVVVQLTADSEELIRRLLQRSKEQGRTDDTPEVVRKRQELYEEQTAVLIDIYNARSLVAKINGLGEIPEVTGRIIEALDARGLTPDA